MHLNSSKPSNPMKETKRKKEIKRAECEHSVPCSAKLDKIIKNKSVSVFRFHFHAPFPPSFAPLSTLRVFANPTHENESSPRPQKTPVLKAFKHHHHHIHSPKSITAEILALKTFFVDIFFSRLVGILLK